MNKHLSCKEVCVYNTMNINWMCNDTKILRKALVKTLLMSVDFLMFFLEIMFMFGKEVVVTVCTKCCSCVAQSVVSLLW